jgi:hypothetical protein
VELPVPERRVGECLGHEERLREEALDAARAAVILARFIHEAVADAGVTAGQVRQISKVRGDASRACSQTRSFRDDRGRRLN